MGMLERTTIFLGAFLLFLVQPMIGNTLLPMFGGTATVWSVCLATFQTLLVGGYFYAHLLGRRDGNSSQLSISRLYLHLSLLLLAAGWLFVATMHRAELLKLAVTMPAALGVFSAVLLMVAFPYVILSANSSLVQDLSVRKYALYAVSNLGSLIGLWAYPLAFERYFTLTQQWMMFASLCFAYAILFALLTIAKKKSLSASIAEEATSTILPSVATFRPWLYFGLSALSCFLLNAVSTHLGSDITPLPLLWVALLSLYLLSYILGFSDRPSRIAPWIGILLIPLAIYATWHMGLAEFRHFKMELVTASCLLFIGGFIIHSRLYASRPDSGHLTAYYLMIALGGAFGGAICSFFMPVVTDRIVEYPIAVALVLGVAPVGIYDKCNLIPADVRPHWLNRGNAVLIGIAVVVGVGLIGAGRVGSAEGAVLKRYRNFYGSGVVAHRTIETSTGEPYEANEFRCNGTTHGFQIQSGRWARKTPTVYYAEHAGGLPLLNHPKAKAGEAMRVGLCGMGIGTLASYARSGDFYRFYEINPAVAALAQEKSLFSFLSDCKGKVEVVVDDARRGLEREQAEDEAKYDVLVVDVFTGDAIPPHMATREAFALYLGRLADHGILAFHLSNWHLDLIPMIKAAAQGFNLKAESYYCSATPYAFESTWAFLSREELPVMFDARCHTKVDFSLVPDVDLMSDERHSLLPYIQWNVN